LEGKEYKEKTKSEGIMNKDEMPAEEVQVKNKMVQKSRDNIRTNQNRTGQAGKWLV